MKVKKSNVLGNQSGFSLIELMVVVAIIGILASIAIPNMAKFQGKAKQSEAKTNLASFYMAEKAFSAEYTGFDGNFGHIGYSPEGKLNYNLGTANTAVTWGSYEAPGNSATILGFTAGTSVAFCAAAGICKVSASSAGTVVNKGAVSDTTFLATAAGIVTNSGLTDTWTMNENKTLTNTLNGL